MEKVEVEGQSVDFFKFTDDGITYYQFDTSKCGPPDPMVNAMAGLKLITNANTKLIMINHKTPAGLLNKISENYDIEESTTEDGLPKLIFSYKAGESEKACLSDNSCH